VPRPSLLASLVQKASNECYGRTFRQVIMMRLMTLGPLAVLGVLVRCTWLEEWRPLFPRCWRLLLQHLWRRLAVVSRRMSLCYVPGRKADGTGGERQLLLLLQLLPRLLQFEVQVVVI